MKCVICGYDETIALKFNTDILTECPNCGIVFFDTAINNNDIKEYYRNQYTMKDENNHYYDIRRLMLLPEQIFLLSILNKYKSPPANLLDFGCDKGYFLEEARHFGYKVVGIELSKTASDYCRMNDLIVYEDIHSVDNKFDIITMNHSLEHLTEPVKMLNYLKDNLNPEGIISIRVPDFGCFWSRILKSKWIWFIPNNHYFNYTIKSLSYLLVQADFDIIFIKKRKPQNFNINRAKGLANKTYKSYFNKSLSIRNLISFYYSWITGTEIFAVARKKSENNV